MPQKNQITTSDVTDQALCDLGCKMFAEPARLGETLTHVIDEPFTIEPHRHRGVLQFDLIDGCGGRVYLDGRWSVIRGMTAMVTYPNQQHGYELTAGHSPSRVFHLKLHVKKNWLAIKHQIFPALQTELPRSELLIDAMQTIMKLALVAGTNRPLLLARLTEAFALWSMKDSVMGITSDITEPRYIKDDPAMAASMQLIDASLDDPPTNEQLAATAGFSTRHFARRFRAIYNCTPHDYITARRLERAKQLLLGQQFKIHQVADLLGFSSLATFSRWFTQRIGTSPAKYRSDPTAM